MSKNTLLVNFGGFGDILNTTCAAKHFKEENKNNKVIWLTRQKYASCIKNNKYIDQIIYNDSKLDELDNPKLTFYYKNAFNQQNIEAYFLAPYSTLDKNKFIARSSLLDIIKYEVLDNIPGFAQEVIPYIEISNEESDEAVTFFNALDKNNKKILFEYETFSNQSPFDESYFDILCEHLDGKNYDLIFTGLKTPSYFENKKHNINFYHYTGSFMSNAPLYNLCDAFVGTSSGITCLTSAKYCKHNIPRIEISHGYHWSSVGWTHNINKKLVFYKKQFKEGLNEYF